MEVKMNKEIRNYQESMFMGLNLRQCIFSLLAIAVAVGIYFGLGKYVGQEMTGWLCILGAAPFAACGFFQYHGMNAEQFAWAYIKSEFLYPKRLLFQSEDLYHACMEETLLWSSIFVTLMANKIGGLQFGIYRNCQISSRVFHTAVAALPLTKANRSDFE